MRIGGLIAVALIGLGLAACSTSQRAEMASRNMTPTGYVERVWALGTNGYGDEEVNANTQEVWFVGNSVTSVQRATALVRYHAAQIGKARGDTHFSMPTYDVTITCDRQGSRVRVSGNATYGNEETLAGKASVVDEVLNGLRARLQALGDTSAQQREKIYLANLQSCYSKRIVSPAAMRTRAEKEAAKAEENK